MKAHAFVLAAAGLLAICGGAKAQTAPPAPTPAPVAAAKPQAPTSLSIYFAPGSYRISAESEATLDEASRIFNDGKPIVMIVTGMADATGSPAPNLLLSQKRADAVFAGLIARGLPPGRFQILAKGATDALSGSETPQPDQAFRKVEITWR
jgi:OOP family OmpA-OmpF porin